jgi:hypothetical protein
MKNILSTIILLSLFISAGAQKITYSVEGIPDTLKKSASVIKRFEQIEYEVSDISHATYKVRRVVAVMNENGKNSLGFATYTNKFSSLEDADIKVYDASGNQITRYKKKDLSVEAVSDGLIDDTKLNYISYATTNYPVVMEIQYELKIKGTLGIPRYQIQIPGEGIEYSTYIAKVPKELDIRYQEQNIKLAPSITEDAKNKMYQWSVKDVQPAQLEEGSVKYENCYPAILLAPNRFSYGGYEGDFSSWKNYGLWYNTLYKDLDILPDEKKIFFQNLVKDASSDREKISRVYGYLQHNFRYVSIQLGIGGLQPFSAAVTDQKKYGDCKALSNYMRAALSSVGIKSYVAIINAYYNSAPVDPKFPIDKFNHVILCVPQPKDTIWLECTSKTTDFAVLGNFTENRNALLITENGGVLVSTPTSKSSDNKFTANTVINLEDNGSARSTSDIVTTGEYKQDFINYLFDEKADDQKWLIVNYLGFKHPDQFTIRKTDTAGNMVTFINLELEKLPEFVAGTKMFLSPRIYKIWSEQLPKSENRKLDYYFECPFIKTDTTAFILPAGYRPDAMPAEKHLSNEYCSYSTKFWYDESKNALMSTASLTLLNYKIPADKYAMVKKFFDDVMVDNNQRIVIKKQ